MSIVSDNSLPTKGAVDVRIYCFLPKALSSIHIKYVGKILQILLERFGLCGVQRLLADYGLIIVKLNLRFGAS